MWSKLGNTGFFGNGWTSGPSAAAKPSAPPSQTGPATLESLSALPPSALQALYNHGTTPKLSDLNGQLKGRALAPHLMDAVPDAVAALRLLTRPELSPWTGKTFQSLSETEGQGHNRLFGGALSVAHFKTHVGPSRAGAFDAIQMDYDVPGNLPGVRNIKDEIREVAPGVYLGQAYLEMNGMEIPLFFFGLQRE
jgi:hypothetical protein